ncbi:MAG TPA: SGNH/GDSL hydrolase family protein [Candidatus Limnocylindria bacterium]|nr:SGNH/GDSL hydrolase family protein [Candidatus Limnocylindria bacterium]
MVKIALKLGLVITLLASGCAWTGSAGARMLSTDRTAPLAYVALGDSTVEGIGATQPEANYVGRLHERLRAVYPQAHTTNLGVAGATAADVVAGQLERAITLAPDLVTLSIGPNDITGRVSVREYERHVDTIFTRLLKETRAVVVVNLLPDLAVTPRFRNSPARERVGRLSVEFNDTLARRARAHGVEVIDLHGPSRVEVMARPELVSSDGYHPSDLGYARWAELMWAGIERHIPR